MMRPRRWTMDGLRWLWTAARSEPACFGYVAAGLYALAITWGLPHATSAERMFPWGPDELAPLRSLGELYRLFGSSEGGFSPQYPLMQYFIQALFAAPYAVWLMLTGGIQGMTGEYPFGLTDPVRSLAVFTVLARIPTVMMAGGTVVVAWWTADRIWSRSAARCTALVTMLSYPMFYYGRTSNVDVPALFWLACGTAVFAIVLKHGLDTRRGALIGLFAALSIGTKDAGYAYFAGVALVLVGLQVVALRRPGGHWKSSLMPLLAGAGIAAVVYVLASGLVFSLERFIAHVDFIVHGTPLPEGVEHPYYYSGEASLRGYLALAGTAGRHVADSLGWPLAVAGLLGFGQVLRARPRLAWLLLPALTVFLGTIVPVRFVLIRFVLPIVYVVGLFAGPALAALLDRTRDGGGAPWRLAQLVVLVSLGWAGVRSADLTVQMWTDSRYELGAWLTDEIGSGDELGYYGSAMKLPHLSGDVSIGAMPNQIMPIDPGQREAEAPGVIVVIPQQDNEPLHEWTLRPEDYRSLLDGSAGVREVFSHPGGGADRVIPFVNPPIKVFRRVPE